MLRSPLFGRRIHIAGSIAGEPGVASAEAVDRARALLEALVPELMARGATFVIPVDAEKTRAADQRAICFDWLIWQAIDSNLRRRPSGAHNPLAIAVQHHKTESQIPGQFQPLWDKLRGSDLVDIKNASSWNMAAKRMETAAQWGDILLTIGGSDGVLFLADLYHQAGKPVIPLPDALCPPDTGSQKLFALGLRPAGVPRLFRTRQDSPPGPDGWVNRLNNPRASVAQRVTLLVELLEALEPPTAFAVRLLDDKHSEFPVVQDFFDDVVKPVIEGELGYSLNVVDGKQRFDFARIDQDIFFKLQRSRLVIADLTGERPNCFLEAGFAIGRELPTIITCKAGGKTHFDLSTVATHFWDPAPTLDERRRKFREHVEAVRDRPALVPSLPLVS